MTRVLVVDDKEENLYYLQVLLTGHGCAVETARHGAEALVLARQNTPDLVVSDLLMPVMDGYTLLRHWKADPRLRRVPFIVYTATYTEAEDEKLALNLGADAFILKPAEPEDFLARLRAVQANNRAEVPAEPKAPMGDEKALLKTYSETLIRKLEEKTLQLEETNRALQKDIAEREAMEKALRESEQRFRQLAENINEVFWLTDIDKKQVLYVSPAYEKVWRRSCQSVYAAPETWLEAVHPDDRDRVARAVAKQALGEYDETFRIIRPDGEVRWIRDRAFPVADEHGDYYRLVGTAEDITEGKLGEERIAEQAALLDQTRDAILVCDLEYRILYWNKGAERIYGWTKDEVGGKSLHNLAFRDLEPLKAAMETLLRQGAWNGDLQQVTKSGGELTIESRWTLLRDDLGAPKSVLAINTDVTERKKIEAQFFRAQRLESIGTLAGGIAHDLNNMLAPVIMSIELLKLKFPDPKTTDILQTLQRSAQRGADLVKQVLSFARGVEGQRVVVNPSHIIREIQNVVRDTFPKSVVFTLMEENNSATVTGDPTQLHQVFLNLCVNARDAMPRGGYLNISMENVELNETHVLWNPEAHPGNYVIVQVSDSGSGIPPDIRDKIFEPFFTTKEVGNGTGLGLSTTSAIVKSHGGFITLESELGKGTTFTVYLPANPSEAALRAPGLDHAPLPMGRGELVLVVDDEQAIRTIAKSTLERFGYRVLLASHGGEAVTAYVSNKNEVAVVLADMAMPFMDGPALIHALRAINPEVKVVGSSGLTTRNNVASTHHVEYFLPKPYTAEALLKTIHLALSGSHEEERSASSVCV